MIQRKSITDQHKKAATAYIRGGVPFRTAMVNAGFSRSWARLGPEHCTRESEPLRLAINAEIEALNWELALALIRGMDPQKERRLDRAVKNANRLHSEQKNGES